MGTGRAVETSREWAEERIVRTFLERAAAVILESRTLDGARFDTVLALAEEVGLTREQLACELRFLELRGVITSVPWQRLDTPDDGARQRGALPGAPAPPGRARRAAPAAAQAPAQDSFRRWIKQKLVGYPSVVLAADDERGLIGVGAHRYHLPEMLAMQIVREVATERDMRLERDLEGASCHSTVAGTQPPDADEPPRSEVELPDPRQLERRESFRSYLRRALAQVPHGVVTFKTRQRLIEAGELFHGVAPQWIVPTINEVAGEMGSRFISQEQAIEHISDLVGELIALDTLADGESRSRIYTEGTNWGLDPLDIEAILRRHIEQVTWQMAQVQQQRWRLVTLGAVGVVLVAAVGLGLFYARRPPATPAIGTAAPAPPPALTAARDADLSWWDAAVQAAATRAGTADGDLAATIARAQTTDQTARGEAYAELVTRCQQHADSGDVHAAVLALLAQWYARDPSDTAARQIRTRLFAPVALLDATDPPDARTLQAAFWGCRTAARLWKEPALPVQRSAELGTSLAAAVGELLDRGLEPTQLENQCVAALARRCYAALPRLAAEHPSAMHHLYRALVAETAGRVDQGTLDRLDVDLLAATLPTLAPHWEDYRDVLHRVARSRDAAVVLKLLDMLSSTRDPQLRDDLVAALSGRLGAAPDSLTSSELIESVRASVGLTAAETTALRWEQLAGRVDAVLHDRDAAHPNPAALLQQTLDRVYLATLACALVPGDQAMGTFQELEVQGPPRAFHDGPRPLRPAEPFVSSYPVSASLVVEQHIEKLATTRSMEGRLTLVRLIANAADTVADIDPGSGQKLAACLLQPKEDAEHQRLLPHVPRLARWNAVRLGLADQLVEPAADSVHQRDLLRGVLGQDVPLQTHEDYRTARRMLLESVLATLAERAESDDEQLTAIDRGSRTLYELYCIQARLLEVPTDADSQETAPTLSAVLRTLIARQARTLDAGRLTATERQWLETLPHQLIAVDFVAENDLQRTVLLEQLWLQTLSLFIAERVPAQAAAARAIVAETQASVAPEDRALRQLRDLETGLLRLWMLCRPHEEAALPGARDV